MTSRPHVLVCCYHFRPSREVASLRVEAISKVAAGAGCPVTVVSEFGSGRVSHGQILGSGVLAAPVPLPPRVLVRLLVSMKRAVGRLLARGPAESSPEHELPAKDAAAGRGIGTSLRDYIFSLLNIVDPYKRWALRARKRILEIARARDLQLIIVSGPPYSAVVAAWSASRQQQIPLIVDFRDPFFAGRLGAAQGGFIERTLKSVFERLIVRDAAAVITASPGIADALGKRYPTAAAKVRVILNGFDIEPAERSIKTNHRLNILFAGAIYINRDPFPFLEALEVLLARPNVEPERVSVTFVGDCSSFHGRPLAAWLQGKRAKRCVTLVSQVSYAELEPYKLAATVFLNLAQEQQRMIPAKTFEQLASGIELLTLCEPDSDTGRLLEGVSGATQIAPTDRPALEAALQDLYDRHVVKGELRSVPDAELRRFSRHEQNRKFLLVMQELVPALVLSREEAG